MFSVTDIPDWDCAELTGKDRTSTTVLTPELFNNLQRCSPITHVDKVQAHVLLLIGEDDRRVPPSQGRNYYHALKGRGKSVDMLWFPGKGHALDHVETSKMVFESVRDLFAKHRK
jgi:dipeptidyl aminopeptidase/acylaminoacyl peptidase